MIDEAAILILHAATPQGPFVKGDKGCFELTPGTRAVCPVSVCPVSPLAATAFNVDFMLALPVYSRRRDKGIVTCTTAVPTLPSPAPYHKRNSSFTRPVAVAEERKIVFGFSPTNLQSAAPRHSVS